MDKKIIRTTGAALAATIRQQSSGGWSNIEWTLGRASGINNTTCWSTEAARLFDALGARRVHVRKAGEWEPTYGDEESVWRDFEVAEIGKTPGEIEAEARIFSPA